MVLLQAEKKATLLLPFAGTSLLGLVLAFGPAMHWARRTIHHPFIPLPYVLFYYLSPGFKGFRNAARFEMLFVLLMPIAASLVLTNLLKNKMRWLQVVVYTVLIIGAVAEFHFPLQYVHAPTFEEFPPVYHWIAKKTDPTAIILETPMYNWDNQPFGYHEEVTREFYSTIHFRRIVGGGSGFAPAEWQELAIRMYNDFPFSNTLSEAKKIGVTYIVVHKKEYDRLHDMHWTSRGHGLPEGNTILETLNTSSAVTLVIHFGDDYVYKLNY